MVTIAATMFVGYFALLVVIQVLGRLLEIGKPGRANRANQMRDIYDWPNQETYGSRMARKRY